MDKKNIIQENLPLIYKLSIVLIFLLVLLNFPPIFTPPAFGKSVSFRIIFSLIVFWFLFDFLFKKTSLIFRGVIEKIRAKKDFSFYTPLILLFTLLISLFFSIDVNFSIFGDPFRGGGFLSFFLLLLFSYFLFFLLSKKDWENAWKVLFFTGVVATFIAVLQWQQLFDTVIVARTSRPFASFGNSTILGVYLAILVFPLLAFFFLEKNKTKKSIYLLSLFIIIFGILLTYTRAAFLGIGVGAIYFVLFFPWKERIFRTLRLGFLFFLLLGVFSIYFVTIFGTPQFAKNNSFLEGLSQRLDARVAFQDPRIGGFLIGWNAILEKPLTGYGVENFAYAFDRHYHPNAPFVYKDIPWWDKAHNLSLEMGIWGGFPALLALLLIFITLFLSLSKNKSIESHATKATLITFFVANFFTVDDFTIYLLFSVIIGYSFFLTLEKKEVNLEEELERRNKIAKYRYPFLLVSIPLLVFFIANYNYNLLISNRDIVLAEKYKASKNCERALILANQATEKENPITPYLLFMKSLVIESCVENKEERVKKLFDLTKEVAEKRPSFTRHWTNLAITSMGYVPYTEEKDKALDNAKNALLKALEISPMRYPIKSDLGHIFIFQGDYENALRVANECLSIANFDQCQYIKGVSMSALFGIEEKHFHDLRDDFDMSPFLNTAINTQIYTKNYEAMIPLYLLLIKEEPETLQNYTSVATAYREIGDYENARKYALKILKIEPEARPIVNEFLDSLK